MGASNTAVVTGASGFIGRHLLRALLESGRRVVAVCRRPEQLAGLPHPALERRPGDLERPESCAAHLSAGATVFHLGAARAVPGVSPQRMEAVNVAAAVALGRAALDAGVRRFVYVSTALIFGPSDGEGPLDESGGYRALPGAALYVRTRVRAALEMRRLAPEGLNLVTACPAIVFGADEPTHPNRLAAQARRLARTGRDVVVGGGRTPRTLVHVDDVVRGLLQAEERGATGEDYLLGGDDCSHREFNRTVLELAGRRPLVRLSVPLPYARLAAKTLDRFRGFDPAAGHLATIDLLTTSWRFRSDKAARELGYRWAPLRDGLRRTIFPARTTA